MTEKTAEPRGLIKEDLVDDRALTEATADRLAHAPIAVQVAKLIAAANPPFALGLFGPWGSGKSSFFELLRREIATSGGDAKIVRYDAWAFAGESLQRHFISSVATALGFLDDGTNDKFHSGLYESKRSVKFDPEALTRSFPVRYAIYVGLFAAAFIATFSFVIALLGRQDVINALLAAIGPIVTGGVVVAALTGIVQSVLAQGKVDVEQAPPSPELFKKRFTELVKKATKGKPDRLVVFVDELDRCHPKDVIAVLTGMRTFFDVQACVFVVAADREVIEHALLDELPTMPTRAEEPYYSTAGAFLDKVFQHQVALPPLRQQRLSHLALALVAERSHGIWAELRAGDGPSISQVMLALIPSHVVSPRRVKVLLNNFATTARVAEARGIDWRARATEIARLTVLRTEFPAVAEDLESEPRLLVAIVERPVSATGRLKTMLDRYPPLTGATVTLAATAPDVAVVDAKDRPRITTALLEQLYRYLARTREFPSPKRDLIFLESASAPVDLADVELGDFIESAVTDDPKLIEPRLDGVSQDERQKAVRLIAGVVTSDVIDEERTNAVSALLAAASTLSDFPEDVRTAAGDAIGFYLSETKSPVEFLPAMLDIGSRLVPAPAWMSSVHSDPDLYATPENTKRVALIADRLEDRARREGVWPNVARHLGVDYSVLTEPIASLPEEVALELLDDERLAASLETRLETRETSEPGLATEDASALIAAARGRNPRSQSIELRTLWVLLDTGVVSAIDTVSAEQAATLELGDLVDKTRFVLAGLEVADPESWATWARSLPNELVLPVEDPELADSGDALDAIAALTERLGEDGAASAYGDIVPKVVALAGAATPEQVAARILPAVTSAIANASADLETQGFALTGLFELRRLPEASQAIESAVTDEVIRIVSSKPTNEALLFPSKVGLALSSASWERIAIATAAVAVAPPVTARTRLMMVVWLVSRIRRLGGKSSVEIPFDEVHAFVVAGDTWFPDAWFKARPSFTEGKRMLFETDEVLLAPHADAVVVWATRLTVEQRTSLLLDWIDKFPGPSSWVGKFASIGLNEAEFIEQIGWRIKSSALGEDRASLARNIEVLRPADAKAQRAVADVILARLEAGTKLDAEIARLLFPALGNRHKSVRRLNDAIRAAARAERLQLKDSDRDALRAANLEPPSRRGLARFRRRR